MKFDLIFQINIDVLENLGLHYRDTIKSVMWVDSSERNCEPVNGTEDRSWIFINLSYDNDYPDPLVLLAWQCSQLEEIVLYGYKYYFDNLIAISRLRGAHLKKLEIAEQDIYDMQQHQYNLTVSRGLVCDFESLFDLFRRFRGV